MEQRINCSTVTRDTVYKYGITNLSIFNKKTLISLNLTRFNLNTYKEHIIN